MLTRVEYARRVLRANTHHGSPARTSNNILPTPSLDSCTFTTLLHWIASTPIPTRPCSRATSTRSKCTSRRSSSHFQSPSCRHRPSNHPHSPRCCLGSRACRSQRVHALARRVLRANRHRGDPACTSNLHPADTIPRLIQSHRAAALDREHADPNTHMLSLDEYSEQTHTAAVQLTLLISVLLTLSLDSSTLTVLLHWIASTPIPTRACSRASGTWSKHTSRRSSSHFQSPSCRPRPSTCPYSLYCCIYNTGL